MQEYRAFCREYDRIAAALDRTLVGGFPSKATFYRWLSGRDLVGVPHPAHCRVLECMFPGWTVAALLKPENGELFDPLEGGGSNADVSRPAATPADLVALYAHRSDTPKSLWLNLLLGATQSIDLFANASLFLPEDNPEAIRILKDKAKAGVQVRILLGDPDDPAMALRGHEERLYDGIPGRIKMALAYYSPLAGVDGVSFRLHGTSLYNSIFRYDDQMLVNSHTYGTYGYLAPILHLRRHPDSDLFDTYMRSLELVWSEESREFTGAAIPVPQ
ncbi:hypothetical protein ACIA49_07060 [Kribbella sp. NPDC051587]|uniref:hypothetical protein n=1 Tax=Kribbella sp. NPDC051587 TaxID=3364119 RepID=UPI003787AED2